MDSTNSLPAFHILAKPTGAICNLNCSYCCYSLTLTLTQYLGAPLFHITQQLVRKLINRPDDKKTAKSHCANSLGYCRRV
jgi:sulfatase maturation enzyme AslB (radical SAM superfamily)